MNAPVPSKNALVVSGAVMVVGGGVAGVQAARGRRFRTGLINASREMMQSGDFSRPAIGALVRDRCGKDLDTLGGGARHE